jgi:hypothetical protein
MTKCITQKDTTMSNLEVIPLEHSITNPVTHPIYDLLSDEIKELLRDISSSALKRSTEYNPSVSLIYLYGIYSNGKKTLIDILKRVIRVVEITDDLVNDHYHQGYMDGKLENLQPDLFVNIHAEYDPIRYYESHSFRLWLKKYNVPVIIISRHIPNFLIYPESNDFNVKLIRMKKTFESEFDPTFKEWIFYVTEDGRVKQKPVVDRSKIINDEAIQIVQQIMKNVK